MAASKKISASLEDYLETIYNLSGDGARCKDIAGSLGVSRASVTGAMKLLAARGLVNYRPYELVSLTAAGRKAAEEVARRHGILMSFFTDVLGANPETAQQAACRAEHALGPEIIERCLGFAEFAAREARGGRDFAGRFRRFCASERKGRGCK